MPSKEKTYLLRHTPEGLTLVRDRDSDQLALEDDTDSTPAMSHLQEPRWDHWYQRKLARPWQATLLGMNIEPIKKARQILRTQDSERYRIFMDRLDILQTLMGVEIALHENHVREGEGANEKYIELAEYCHYAESLGWTSMATMRSGLRLDERPPVLKSNAKLENSIVRVLDVVFRCVVPQYMDAKGKRSAIAVNNWLKESDETLEIGESTLRSWFNRMMEQEAEKKA
jgi:hypothetical protein